MENNYLLAAGLVIGGGLLLAALQTAATMGPSAARALPAQMQDGEKKMIAEQPKPASVVPVKGRYGMTKYQITDKQGRVHFLYNKPDMLLHYNK